MNHVHQTQCPHCHHQFKVTDEQLTVKSGFASCEQCKKIFSAIDNLVTKRPAPSSATGNPSVSHAPVVPSLTADSPSFDSLTLEQPAPVTTPSVNKTPVKTATETASELLFSDDFGVDHLDSDGKDKPTANPSASSLPTFDPLEIDENFDQRPVTVAPAFSAPQHSEQGDDEAWLAKLLAEEEPPEAPVSPLAGKLTQHQNQKNDITQMLEEFGVDTAVEAPPANDEYLQRMNARFEKQAASHKTVAQSRGMNLVWLLGSLLLLGSLALQYVVFNVENLVKNPQNASRLQGICQSLPIKCQLPIADTQQIQVDTVSLTTSKADSKKTDLVLMLKNTAPLPNIYPNLKVTLRSGNDTKAQFILPTQQYLPPDSSRLLPGQVKPLKLRIDYPRKAFEQANVELFY